MSPRAVLLDVASFLDSEPAAALQGVGREDVRAIATAFLTACYEDLGKAPRFLDGEDARVLLAGLLPGWFKRRDPLAEHVPAVLAAFLDHLEATEVVTHAFELRTGLPDGLEVFLEAVRAGTNEPRAGASREAPVVHRAEKLGRNEPCFCGSGKKFKKCHGRNA
jgi:hypothetical protein